MVECAKVEGAAEGERATKKSKRDDVVGGLLSAPLLFRECSLVIPELRMIYQFTTSSDRPVISEAMKIASGPVFPEEDLPDMNFQIHCMEKEAYGAVLRAFSAQSESLTWSKETLMSDLRKELRLSDDEHRQLLGTVNSDESLKAIREWCRSTDAQKLAATNSAGYDSISMGHVPRKKLKTAHSSGLASPKYLPSAQSSPAANIPPAGPAVTVHVRNDQWGNNPSSFSPQTNVGQAIVPVHQNRQEVSTGKVRGPLPVQASNRGSAHSDHDYLKSDIIEIRPTDKLIHEVEKACGGENPDPVQLERAKRLLREHERALMEAIGKLADVTDCDESPDQRWHQHSSEKPQRNAYGVHNAAYRKLDRARGYYTEDYVKDHSGIGIPFIDLPDDEYD